MSGKRGRPTKQHGTTYAREGRAHWYFNLALIKDGVKEWVPHSSGVLIGDSEAERARSFRKAEAVRRRAQDAINASHEEFGAHAAAVTVRQLANHWFQSREAEGVATWKNEKQRIEDYVLPEIGDLLVLDVKARHLIEAYRAIASKKYKSGELLSQKTLDETHRHVCKLFDHAILLDVLPGDGNPAEKVDHRKRQSKAEVDPRDSRTTGSYTLAEVATLITHPSVPFFWRALFTTEALAMTRATETATLKFKDWDSSTEDLSAPVGERALGLLVVVDWKKRWRKGATLRHAPVHPVLAAMLAEWKLSGFFQTFGRHPTPDDLIFPVPPGGRRAPGTQLTHSMIWKKLQVYLAQVGLLSADKPTRAQHALRRAGFSAYGDAGAAVEDRLRISHKPNFSKMGERYDDPAWRRLSEAVLKLSLPKPPSEPHLIRLPIAVGSPEAPAMDARSEVEKKANAGSTPGGEFSCLFPATTAQPSESTAENEWRRRESNSPRTLREGPSLTLLDDETREATPPYVGAKADSSGPGAAVVNIRVSKNADEARRLELLREHLERAADLLATGTKVPSAVRRPQALASLRLAASYALGRTALAVEIALELMEQAQPRSIREAIAAGALVDHALRKLEAP